MNSLHSSKNDDINRVLIPALIKCFGIIFIGYIFGRFQILPNAGRKGLGIFVQNLALPVLIFKLVATISFSSVNWAFVASVFIAKTVIFCAVALISMILMRPMHVGKAGLYAILATQSNDFALGYPLLVSLYQHTHSDYSSLLYLTAPIQVLLLNPPAFFMLEIYKQAEGTSCQKGNPFITIIRGVFSNPIVFMTILGVVWNFSFSHTIQLPIAQLIDTISSAFPATALFLLGHSMAGKISTFKGHFVLTPVLLILAKNVVLPIVLQRIVMMLTNGLNEREIQDLSSLGFLYGTIPCAPAVFVFACQYDLSLDVVASTVVFSTLVSAPMMFVSATMATLSFYGSSVTSYMEGTMGYISSVSLISCLWLLSMLVMGRRWHTASYGAITYLVSGQLITSVGGILCLFRNKDSKAIMFSQYVLTTAGILSTRICTVFLAILPFLLFSRCVNFSLRARYIKTIEGFVASFGIAFLLTGSLLLYETPAANSNPNFPLGYAQVLLTAVSTFLCLVVTVVCLISQHKYRKTLYSDHSCKNSGSIKETTQITERTQVTNYGEQTSYGSLESHEDGEIYHSGNSATHDLSHNNSRNQSSCSKLVSVQDESIQNNCTSRTTSSIHSSAHICDNFCDSCRTHSIEQRRVSQNEAELHEDIEANYEENDHILRQTMLLIVLSLSMLVTFFVCLWKLLLEDDNGIFVELELLDIALSYGQGIIFFLIFGLDDAVIQPITKLRRYIQSWKISFPVRSCLSSGA